MSKVKSLKTYFLSGSLLASYGVAAQPTRDPNQYQPQASPVADSRATNSGTRGLSVGGAANILNSVGFKTNIDQLLGRRNNSLNYSDPNSRPQYTFSQISNKNQFKIDCDVDIQKSQCADQINHYSLIGGNNKLLEFAATVSCQEFDWLDYRSSLDSSTCESRLNCATGTASRNSMSVCVPDRTQLNNAIPVDEYNKIVGHAILRNLTVGYEAERVQKILSLSKNVWGEDAPAQCKKLMEPKLTKCSRDNLDTMSRSFQDYANYLVSSDESLKVLLEKDSELKLSEPKNNNNIIETLNRIREIKALADTDAQNEKDRVAFFQDAVYKILDENQGLSTDDLVKKIRSEINRSDEEYAAYYHGAVADFYMTDKTKLSSIIDRYKKNSKSSNSKKIFTDMVKDDFRGFVDSQCSSNEQFNLENSCEVFESLRDRHNSSKQLQFVSGRNRNIFLGRSLDFMSSDPLKKGAFFVRACENTDMQVSYVNSKKDDKKKGSGLAGDDGGAKSGDELIDDSTEITKSLTFAQSGGTASAVVSESSEASDDTTISSQLANAFTDANSSFANSYNPFQSSFGANDAAATIPASDEADKDGKKSKENESSDRSLGDRTAQGFDAIQKELEALKAQLAQKSSDSQKTQAGQVATPGQATNLTTAESAETVSLKKRIAELEKEMAKESVKPKKSSFDSFDDSVWSRGSNEGRRGIASEGSSGSGAKAARSQGMDSDLSNGGGSGGSSAGNRNAAVAAAAQAGASAGLQNLSLVKYENQSMVVLPISATKEDILNEILKNNRESFFIPNKDGTYTFVKAEFKDGKPLLDEDGTPVYSVKQVTGDKVSPVKSRGVASEKVVPKVRELKELKDPATRKRELDELLKKTKK